MNVALIESKNMLSLESKNLNSVAKQFRCPEGNEGIVIDELLNENHDKMIRQSIQSLELEEKNRVLELGHGSCKHLPYLMEQASNIKYFGMEISELMKDEAVKINSKYIKKNDALFQLYDGYKIPYVHNIFDRILAVNTIYFSENPVQFLNEMFRVLKPGGVFVLTFANSTFIDKLSSVDSDVFILYDEYKIKKLIGETRFESFDIKERFERKKTMQGEWIDKSYSVVTLRKKPKELIL